MLISIVIPCCNEAKILAETQRGLGELTHKLTKEEFEFIYVDENSSDETAASLRQLSVSDARVRGLCLSRNVGRRIAIAAGLEHASGDAVVIMDPDDPPEAIVQMYARWLEGYKIALGQRQEQAVAHGSKRFLDRIAPPENASNFHLLDREVVRAFLQRPERERSLSDVINEFRQVAVPYQRGAAAGGGTNSQFLRRCHSAADALFSSAFPPLRLAIWIGLAVIGISLAMIVVTLVAHLFLDPSRWERGWASLFVAILFLGGVQLVSLGVVGEYLNRIYGEVKKGPLYQVRERIGFHAEKKDAPPDGRSLPQ